MFENPRRGRQAKNFTTNVPKILDLKSSSEQIFFRKLSLGAPDDITLFCIFLCPFLHDYDVKVPNFAFCGSHKQGTTTFYFSF